MRSINSVDIRTSVNSASICSPGAIRPAGGGEGHESEAPSVCAGDRDRNSGDPRPCPELCRFRIGRRRPRYWKRAAGYPVGPGLPQQFCGQRRHERLCHQPAGQLLSPGGALLSQQRTERRLHGRSAVSRRNDQRGYRRCRPVLDPDREPAALPRR